MIADSHIVYKLGRRSFSDNNAEVKGMSGSSLPENRNNNDTKKASVRSTQASFFVLLSKITPRELQHTSFLRRS